MASSLTKEQFIEKAVSVHGNKFSYDKTIYVNMRKPITITCKTHGEFKQSPMNHLKTEGCPKCGYEGRHTKKEEKVDTIQKPTKEKAIPIDDNEDEYIVKIVEKYSNKIDTLRTTINPFTSEQIKTSNKPYLQSPIQSSIVLNDTILENAYKTGVLTYEDINDESLNKYASDLVDGNIPYSTAHDEVDMVKKVIAVDWNSISLNASLTFNQLIKYREKIELDYVVFSPAFVGYTSANSLSYKSNLISFADLQQIATKHINALLSLKLDDDWFGVNEEMDIFLYTHYIIPKLVNTGITLTKKMLEKYKTKITLFVMEFISSRGDSISIYKTANILKSLPEELFLVVLDGISFSILRKKHLETYMKNKYMSDSALEKLIQIDGDSMMDLISKTQVPSIKFIRKYRDKLDVILIMRNMIKNNRIFTSFIEEFIDELIAYTKKREELFKTDVNIKFTGNENMSNPYFVDEDFRMCDAMDRPMDMPMFTGSISYVKNGSESPQFEYYKEDIMKSLYSRCNSKLFKKLYETMRLDNSKNSEMIGSIQSELETLLNNSKILQDKLNKFKKSI